MSCYSPPMLVKQSLSAKANHCLREPIIISALTFALWLVLAQLRSQLLLWTKSALSYSLKQSLQKLAMALHVRPNTSWEGSDLSSIVRGRSGCILHTWKIMWKKIWSDVSFEIVHCGRLSNLKSKDPLSPTMETEDPLSPSSVFNSLLAPTEFISYEADVTWQWTVCHTSYRVK